MENWTGEERLFEVVFEEPLFEGDEEGGEGREKGEGKEVDIGGDWWRWGGWVRGIQCVF